MCEPHLTVFARSRSPPNHCMITKRQRLETFLTLFCVMRKLWVRLWVMLCATSVGSVRVRDLIW